MRKGFRGGIAEEERRERAGKQTITSTAPFDFARSRARRYGAYVRTRAYGRAYVPVARINSDLCFPVADVARERDMRCLCVESAGYARQSSPFCFAWDARSLVNEEDCKDLRENAGTWSAVRRYIGEILYTVARTSSSLSYSSSTRGVGCNAVSASPNWLYLCEMDEPTHIEYVSRKIMKI